MDKMRRMKIWRAAGRGGTVACLGLLLMGCAASAGTADAAADGPVALSSGLGSYLAARHAQQLRDYGPAADFMGRALADDPGNADLQRRAFVLRVSEGHIAEAVPLARRILETDHGNGLAQMVLLVEEIKAGDFKAATERAHVLSSDGTQRIAAPLIVAWCEMGLQHPAQALQALDALKDMRGVQTLRDLHAGMLSDYADRVDDAEQSYKKVIGDQPRLTWRTVEIAGNFYERHQRTEEARRLYARLGDTEQGEEVVGQALARLDRGAVPARVIASPRDGAAEALFDLASILNQRETIDVSLIYARLALELRPDFPLAQMLLAQIDESQQHIADALALYRAVDPASPLAWSARLRAAAMLDALDRTDEAATELKRMAAERPKDTSALVALGDILRSRSRFTDAAAAYDEAIGRVDHPEARDWRLFYSRAVALERSGQWPRAEADLKRALELQPDQPLVLNYLGYSWIDKGVNLDPALKMVKRAVELRPNDGYIVDSLGWAYYRLGDFRNATQYLERAIELLPEDPTVNDHLGDAYWQTGRVVEARYQWHRALQFKPEADQVKSIETKLDHGIAKLPATTTTGGG
jgi:tetratricopeptide (TPR) repeat protein